MQLSPELDKLRSKRLIFGCFLEFEMLKPNMGIIQDRIIEETNSMRITKSLHRIDKKFHKYTVIGHPLTWGRLCHLYHKYLLGYVGCILPSGDPSISDLTLAFEDIQLFLDKHYALYDKTEENRASHIKRPELLSLLTQFVELLPENSKDV